MKKGMKIVLAVVAVVLLSLSSIASSVQVEKSLSEREVESLSETINVVCIVSNIDDGYSKTILEIPKDEYSELRAFIIMHKESFMTVMRSGSTNTEIEQAFNDIEPFFQSLISYGLTAKSMPQIKELCQKIRGEANEPKEPSWGSLGIWNGLPTPFYGNIACVLLSYANHGIGYALGTHSLLPTIGADLGILWRNSHWAGYDPIVGGVVPAETISEGLLGCTLQTGGHLGVALGFVGFLLGVIPSGVIFTGLIRSLMVLGFATMYVGWGIIPG